MIHRFNDFRIKLSVNNVFWMGVSVFKLNGLRDKKNALSMVVKIG